MTDTPIMRRKEAARRTAPPAISATAIALTAIVFLAVVPCGAAPSPAGSSSVTPATAPAAGSNVPAGPSPTAEGIAFGADIDAALQAAQDPPRVTVLYFFSPTCTWCRKLQATTFIDARVVALSRRMVWVKVNAESDPETPARLGLAGVPALVLVNVRGEALAVRAGYLSAEDLLALLRKYADQAQARPEKGPASSEDLAKRLGESKTPAETAQAVSAALVRLALADGTGRETILDALATLGPRAWEPLARGLADERLAVRAAASSALAAVTGADLPFDAFGPLDLRKRQETAWTDWIAQNKDKPPPAVRKATTQPRPRVHRERSDGRMSAEDF